MLAWLVDHLPLRLWSPGNVRVGGRLHFCVGDSFERTIEWNGKLVLGGRSLGAQAVFDRFGSAG
ncbi:hypothetical protein [Micromonospora chokoriensis]